MTFDLKFKLNTILPVVQNPGRYIGGEANQIVKNPADMLATMALVFPDVYELGMSHNGTNILYHLINREPDLAAERSFAPWLDMAEIMREKNIPLYSLESYRPLSEFDCIGISLQTELNFTNVPYILELANVPAWSKDRTESDPFVIGGGPCVANPEPVADFFDLFVIGDGEIITTQILRIIGQGRKKCWSRQQTLAQLQGVPGIYVPLFLETTTNEFGEIVPVKDMAGGAYSRSLGIKRQWVETLHPDLYPIHNIIPNMNLVHERFSVEVMRGCTQGCRFCQAGYWYRPNRELPPDDVIDIAKAGMQSTGEDELGLLSLSTADYSQIEPVTDYLLQENDFEHVNLSLPSLRANSFGQKIAQKVAVVSNMKSATFAPETGSARLRRIINKNITDEEMLEAAEAVFRNGFNKIKLYTMIGLPTETLDDMQAFCELIEKLQRIGQKYSKRNHIHANIAVMVPKPFTPMQWLGFADRHTVDRHLQYVLSHFRGNRTVRLTWADYNLAQLETFYSRGDRSLSALIYEAYHQGLVFESFTEQFDYFSWQGIWHKHGFAEERLYANRKEDHVFPWDFIHAGVSKSFLQAEYKRMFSEDVQPVSDCKWGGCQHCGIPGNGADIQLSVTPEKYKAPSHTIDDVKRIAQARKEIEHPSFKYILTYTKTGLSRFMAHHHTLDLIIKSLRRHRIQFNHTKGFNAKPIIRNPGALPLGIESDCEMAAIDIQQELDGDLSKWGERLSEIFPAGMAIIRIEFVEKAKLPHQPCFVYRLSSSPFNPTHYVNLVKRFTESNEPIVITHREKTIDARREIEAIGVDNDALVMKVRTNTSGATISPYVLLAALFQVDVDQTRQWTVSKHLS